MGREKEREIEDRERQTEKHRNRERAHAREKERKRERAKERREAKNWIRIAAREEKQTQVIISTRVLLVLLIALFCLESSKRVLIDAFVPGTRDHYQIF